MIEQDIIEQFFQRKLKRKDVIVGSGDDAAVLSIPEGQQLVVSIDTLNAGVHFPYFDHYKTSAYDIGYKTVAVNLSDLAAMGAQPAWLTVSLSIPENDSAWLDNFAKGLFAVLDEFNVELIGGDLNRGPLSVTAQAHGFVPTDKAILQSKAQVGDLIYISGELGTAACALKTLNGEIKMDRNHQQQILSILNCPKPKIHLGLTLRGLANSAIDLSDGLLSDLTRILNASRVGAKIDIERLPINPIVLKYFSVNEAIKLAINGGDDYELCFTISKEKEGEIVAMSQQLALPLTKIGEIIEGSEVYWLNGNDKMSFSGEMAFHHFV